MKSTTVFKAVPILDAEHQIFDQTIFGRTRIQ